MDPKRLRFVATFSAEPSTLKRAYGLLSCITGDKTMDGTIASASLIVGVASIVKMIADRISYTAHILSEVHGELEKAYRLIVLFDKGLVYQVKEFPFVFREGKYFIESANAHFHRIRSMINHRNKLVHIPDGKVVLNGDDQWLEIKYETLIAKIPLQPDPWDLVAPTDAKKKMLDSAMLYYTEVILPGDQYKQGQIIRKCGQRPHGRSVHDNADHTS